MILTNQHNLPDSIVNAIRNDPYDSGDSDYTATQLINPPRIVHLSKRHAAELTEDAMDGLWRLLGQAMHAILERGQPDNAFTEERIFLDVLGRKISGATDLYHDGGLLRDYKVTSAWTIVFGDRLHDWEKQLNILAHLFRSQGFPVTGLEAVVILRDWSQSKAKADSGYPQQPMLIVPLELWTPEYTEEWIKLRVGDLIAAESLTDDALPACLPDEMWERPTKYAAMKTGRKSAVRVCDTEPEALRYVAEHKATHVVKRTGERVRCAEYCVAAPFCPQYREYVANQPKETDDGE
jgi:hypothetical protein